MARLDILLGIAEPRRTPIEAASIDWRLGPKSVRQYGMRSVLSIHRVKTGKAMLSCGRLRGPPDARLWVHEDMVMDLGNDDDEWVRESGDDRLMTIRQHVSGIRGAAAKEWGCSSRSLTRLAGFGIMVIRDPHR